jgi:outer membrane lipoprotein SlyB
MSKNAKYSTRACVAALFVVSASLTLQACATDGSLATGSPGNCSINNTAVGAVGGGAAGAAAGAILAGEGNRAEGAIIGFVVGTALGALAGSQADKQCEELAKQQALDAAVEQFEAAERQAAEEARLTAVAEAEAEAARVKLAQESAAARASRKPSTSAGAKPAQRAVPTEIVKAKAPPPPRPAIVYESINWTGQSASGSVTPKMVIRDTQANTICTLRDEEKAVPQNAAAATSQQRKSIKSCRNSAGKWVDVAV